MLGFWIFMLILALLIPAAMIFFGSRFSKTSPNEINMVYGYRTNMSVKNKDTWIFAHNHIGKLWENIGLFMLAPTVISMIFVLVLGRDIGVIGIVGAVVCGVQIAGMLIPIFFTEMALNAVFDKDGNRRK
jgi:hypothetical protein